MDEAYLQLKAELDRTSVISDQFKSEILQWAIQIIRQAYARGRVDEKADRIGRE